MPCLLIKKKKYEKEKKPHREIETKSEFITVTWMHVTCSGKSLNPSEEGRPKSLRKVRGNTIVWSTGKEVEGIDTRHLKASFGRHKRRKKSKKKKEKKLTHPFVETCSSRGVTQAGASEPRWAAAAGGGGTGVAGTYRLGPDTLSSPGL